MLEPDTLTAALGRNTAWMLAGQLARTFVQAVYFVLVARSLGVDQYGAFVAALAVVMIVAPFVSLGSGFIMIREVSRDRTAFGPYFANALVSILVSGSVLAILSTAIAGVALTVPIALVGTLALAELVCARIVELVGHAFIAFEHVKWTSILQLLINVLRLAAIAVVVRIRPDAIGWAIGYLAATIVAMVMALYLLRAKYGLPRLRWNRAKFEPREGFYFAIGLSAQSIYNDLDKTFVSQIAGLADAGVYGAANRIVDVAFAPITSLLAAAYADFFRRGARGLRGSLEVARKLLPIACGYAVVIAVVVMLCAPIVPYILGDSYDEAVGALRWLAPLVVFRAVHYFLADSLSGAGHQKERSRVQIGIAILNVVLLCVLVPRYGWRGAAWVSLACDALLCVGLGWVVKRVVDRLQPA